MIFYIYILYSPSSDKYYVGHSNDPQRRLFEHNNPRRPKYTSNHLPWELKCVIPISGERAEAMRAEKIIKKRKSRIYIENLLCDHVEHDRLAQLVKSPA